MTAETMEQLLETIDLGSARGRRAGTEFSVEIVRSLSEEDITALLSPPPVQAGPQTLLQVRHSHHQLAQLISSGTVSDSEAGLMVGYSPAYISTLRGDPAFEELLAQYSAQRAQVFVDTVERMRGLGLRFLEELESRLENTPEAWTRREILEAAELLLVKPLAASRGQSAAAPAVSVNVKFVSPDGQAAGQERAGMAAVDLDYEDIA